MPVRTTLSASLLLILFLTSCAVQMPSIPGIGPDPVPAGPITVYYNADVVTMNPDQASAESVAIQDGRIIGVGSNDELETEFPLAYQRVNLKGQTLLPGFIDAHGHISFTSKMVAAPNVASPPVGPAQTINDVIAILDQFKQQSSGEGWIFGFGYDDSLLAEGRHPTRSELDQVSADRPVGILHVSGHLMSCNSVCLKLAGITADTPDPEGGVIRRQTDSTEPNGVLEETAMKVVLKVLPIPDEQTQFFLLDKAQDYYAEHGITTVQDGAALNSEVAFLRRAATAGRLRLDVAAYPVLSFLGNEDVQIEHQPEYKNGFRVAGVKLVLDGSPQGKTAWLTKPYFQPPQGQADDYLGYPILDTGVVQNHINAAFASDTPVIAHANGDAAADQLINAVIKANARFGNDDRRTVMIHAQTVREDQIQAMAENNMIPSYFSAHTFYWGDWHRDSVFGEQRAERISPLKSSIDKGLRFTTHNDTPVVPPDMMRLIWASVNRQTRSGKTLGAAQKITPYQALKSVTIDAAYQYFEEAEKGSIEVGKKADLVILDGNPLQVEPINIKDINVLRTIKDGNVVFARGNE